MATIKSLQKHSKQEYWAFFKQAFKFGIVGVSNTLISTAIYYIFIWINQDLYLAGQTVGFIVGTLNSYFWNNKYVFNKTQKGNVKPLVKTFVCYGGTYLLSMLLLVFQVEALGISEWIAPVINLFITIPLNFLLNRFWAFK